MLTLKEFVRKKRCFVAAHRGSSGTAPENTRAAYMEALLAGADMIETDVQVTADRIVVAAHDPEKTGLEGNHVDAGAMLYSELADTDIGGWFAPEFSGERIMTLGQIIDLVKGSAYLMVEAKRNSAAGAAETAEIIYGIVKDSSYLEYTLFGSFDYDLLKALKVIDPSVHIAAIKRPDTDIMPGELKASHGIEAFICSRAEINEDINNNAKENGVYLAVYTTDNEEQLDRISNYEVKAVVTNFPRRVIGLIEERGALS